MKSSGIKCKLSIPTNDKSHLTNLIPFLDKITEFLDFIYMDFSNIFTTQLFGKLLIKMES